MENYMKIFQFMTFRPKPLRISFYKTEDFKMVLDVKNKCLFLYAYELFEKICDKIKYLISKKKRFYT